MPAPPRVTAAATAPGSFAAAVQLALNAASTAGFTPTSSASTRLSRSRNPGAAGHAPLKGPPRRPPVSASAPRPMGAVYNSPSKAPSGTTGTPPRATAAAGRVARRSVSGRFNLRAPGRPWRPQAARSAPRNEESQKVDPWSQTSRGVEERAIGPVSPGPRRPGIVAVKLCVRLSRQKWWDTAKRGGQQHGRHRNLVGCERALVPMDSKTMAGMPEATLGERV